MKKQHISLILGAMAMGVEAMAQESPNVVYVFPDQYRNYAMEFWAQPDFAGQLVALGGQNLDQRIHSAAAATDKVDLFHIVQQMLAIIRVHEHSKALLQILTAAAQTDSFQIWGHILII